MSWCTPSGVTLVSTPWICGSSGVRLRREQLAHVQRTVAPDRDTGDAGESVPRLLDVAGTAVELRRPVRHRATSPTSPPTNTSPCGPIASDVGTKSAPGNGASDRGRVVSVVRRRSGTRGTSSRCRGDRPAGCRCRPRPRRARRACGRSPRTGRCRSRDRRGRWPVSNSVMSANDARRTERPRLQQLARLLAGNTRGEHVRRCERLLDVDRLVEVASATRRRNRPRTNRPDPRPRSSPVTSSACVRLVPSCG